MNWKGPDGENPGEGFPLDDDPCAVDIVKEDILYNAVEAYVCEGLCHQHKGSNQDKAKVKHKLKVCVHHKHKDKHSEGDHCRAGGRFTSSATMKHSRVNGIKVSNLLTTEGLMPMLSRRAFLLRCSSSRRLH